MEYFALALAIVAGVAAGRIVSNEWDEWYSEMRGWYQKIHEKYRKRYRCTKGKHGKLENRFYPVDTKDRAEAKIWSSMIRCGYCTAEVSSEIIDRKDVPEIQKMVYRSMFSQFYNPFWKNEEEE